MSPCADLRFFQGWGSGGDPLFPSIPPPKKKFPFDLKFFRQGKNILLRSQKCQLAVCWCMYVCVRGGGGVGGQNNCFFLMLSVFPRRIRCFFFRSQLCQFTSLQISLGNPISLYPRGIKKSNRKNNQFSMVNTVSYTRSCPCLLKQQQKPPQHGTLVMSRVSGRPSCPLPTHMSVHLG